MYIYLCNMNIYIHLKQIMVQHKAFKRNLSNMSFCWPASRTIGKDLWEPSVHLHKQSGGCSMMYCQTSQTSCCPPQCQLLRTLVLSNQSRGCSVLATRHRLYPWKSLAWSLFKEPASIYVGDFGEEHLHVIIFCLKIDRFIQTLFKQNHQHYQIRGWNPAEVGIPVVISPPPPPRKQKVAHVRFRDSKRNTFFNRNSKYTRTFYIVVVPIKPKKGWWIDTILREPSQSHPKWKVQVQSTLLENIQMWGKDLKIEEQRWSFVNW